MPVRVIFRCDFCGALPDEETQSSLEHPLRLLLHGTYVDADPGNWLVSHGRQRMYASGPTLGVG